MEIKQQCIFLETLESFQMFNNSQFYEFAHLLNEKDETTQFSTLNLNLNPDLCFFFSLSQTTTTHL